MGDPVNPDDLLWIDYRVYDDNTDLLLEEKINKLISVEKSTFPSDVKEQLLKSSKGDSVSVVVDKPYGDRDPNKIRVVPLRSFHANRVNPYPGLPVMLDGLMAVVKSVNGGRVIVDFNHPFAGRRVRYVITIREIVSDPAQKIKAIGKVFSIDENDISIDKDGNTYVVHVDPEKYKNVLDSFKANVVYFLPNMKVRFE